MTKKEALGVWLPLVELLVHNMPECQESLHMAANALNREIIKEGENNDGETIFPAHQMSD